MNLESICHQLLSALVNGGYQGILLTLLVAFGLKLIPHTNAATRHLVWFGTLLAVASLPLVHLLFANSSAVKPNDAKISPTPNVNSDLPPAGLSQVEVETAPTQLGASMLHPPRETIMSTRWTVVEPYFSAPWGGDYPELFSSPAPPEPSYSQGNDVPPRTSRRSELSESRIDSAGSGAASTATGEPKRFGSWPWPESILSTGGQLALPRQTALFLVGVWLTVAAFRVGRLVQQWLQLRTLKRIGTEAPETWQTVFGRLAVEMGLRRNTRLMIGPAASVPLVAGFWRPAVVLPAGMFGDAAEPQLHQVMRHELGHVIRRDDWVNLFQQMIKAVLFFHPAVGWICERLSLEREIACDDHVLAATRTPRAYALWLTNFAGRRQHREIAAAPAAWNQQTQLKERITMILDSKRNASTRLAMTRAGVVLAVSAICAGWMLQAGPRLALTGVTADVDTTTETVITVEDSVEPIAELTIDANVQTIVGPSGATLAVWTEPPPAQIAVGELGTASISSGPREKPVALTLSAPSVPSPTPVPAPAVAPKAPKHPTVVVRPALPAFPSGPHGLFAFNSNENEDAAPKPSPAKAKAKDSDDRSLERRLERLERAVEKLSKLGDMKQFEALNEFALKFRHDFDPEKFARMSEVTKESPKKESKAGKAAIDEKEIAQIREQAQREAQHAVREAERATKEIMRSATEARSAAHAAQRNAKNPDNRKEIEIRKNALESARKSLEKQVESIERQIEQLEETQEQLDEQLEELEERKSSGDNSNPDKKPAATEPSNEPKKVAN